MALTICTNARNGIGFSRCGVSPGPSLSRLEENNDKSRGKRQKLTVSSGSLQKVTGFFQSFWLEREKRNTSKDFHLFRELPGGMGCTIWISNRNYRFLLTNDLRLFQFCGIHWLILCFKEVEWKQWSKTKHSKYTPPSRV